MAVLVTEHDVDQLKSQVKGEVDALDAAETALVAAGKLAKGTPDELGWQGFKVRASTWLGADPNAVEKFFTVNTRLLEGQALLRDLAPWRAKFAALGAVLPPQSEAQTTPKEYDANPPGGMLANFFGHIEGETVLVLIALYLLSKKR